MIIFVSGSSGYLGSHLVKALSQEHQVVMLMRRSSSRERIGGVSTETVYVDEIGALENAFALYQPDAVINTSALYGRKGESLSALVCANIDFPAQLLTLANKYKSRIFIHTGTSLPDDISPYALTKNTFVKLAQFNTAGSLKFVSVALEHFYGAADDSSKFTSYVINACLAGDELALTDGRQERDFIYIDDVVAAYKVLISNVDKLNAFETVPLGSGVAPTIRELVEMIHDCSHSKSTLKFGAVAMRENELMYSCADTSRLKELGWQPAYSLESGIKAALKGKG
jgi:CDP-paratose synthetase